MKNNNSNLIKTLIISTVIFFSVVILLAISDINSNNNSIIIISTTSGLIFLLFILYIVYKFYEDKKKKFSKVLNSIENSPKELERWLRRNFNWLEWILRTRDSEIVTSFQNSFDGSVSENKLKSLKLYEEFEKTYDGEWTDINRFFRLLPSKFISSEYRKLLYKSLEIEENISVSFYGFENKHIESQEHILTLRKQSIELTKVIYLLMHQLKDLNNINLDEEEIPSREVKIIKNLRKRKKFFKNINETKDLLNSIFRVNKDIEEKLVEKMRNSILKKQKDDSKLIENLNLDKLDNIIK